MRKCFRFFELQELKKRLIVDNSRIAFKDGLCLGIKDVGHFMDLKFVSAVGATQAHPAAGARHFKFPLAFFTFHSETV